MSQLQFDKFKMDKVKRENYVTKIKKANTSKHRIDIKNLNSLLI